jgi:putative transposase
VRNPVRAGICNRADEWPWSSYRATAGMAPAPAFLDVDPLLRMFGRSTQIATSRYADFVEDGAE